MSPCDQMVTVPLSFMEWVDPKITPIQNSALYPVALLSVAQELEDGSSGRLIDCLQSAAGFLDRSI
jgi:hypothetical protein